MRATSRDMPRAAAVSRGAGLLGPWLVMVACVAAAADVRESPAGYSSPVDVAVSSDGRWLVAATAADTVALVDRTSGERVDEIAVGGKPVAVVRHDGAGFLVATLESGRLVGIDVRDGRLVERGSVRLGCEPRSVAVSGDGRLAVVALSASDRVELVAADSLELVGSITVGRRPWAVAWSADGSIVGVACASPMKLVLVDAATRSVRSRHPLQGFNPGRLAFGPGDRELYLTFTYDGGSYPSPGNIRRGWVTGSRIGRLTLETGVLEGLTLDVPGRAVGDVFGLAVTPADRLLVTAGGTHELLSLSTDRLPWTQIGGAEVMDAELARDTARFRRIELGGRPLGICLAPDGRTAFVANSLLDAVQEIDVAGDRVVGVHAIPAADSPTESQRLARAGAAIFYDARRSLDQWYSCHTCHHEGGGSTVTFDTRNDGSTGTYKTVLPLWYVARTGPWTWHGWQHDLRASLEKSLVESMQGPPPTAADVVALAAFLDTLEPPPSPHLEPDGSLSAAAERGRALFESGRTGCRECHAGDTFTTPELHDVGQGRSGDRYQGYSVPTLRGIHRKTMYLHHGRVKSLARLLDGMHGPETVSGLEPLSPAEIDDLVAYLESL